MSLRSRLLVAAVLTLASRTSLAEEEVRIAIAEDRESVEIAGDKLEFFDATSGERLAFASGPTAARVTALGAQVTLRPNDPNALTQERTPTADRILVEGPEGVRVDGRLFLGRVLVRRWEHGVHVINRIPMEIYLLGIVGSEMSPAWPTEALKAQAVSARTYAFQRRMMMRAAGKPYDLESSVLSQVYAGAERVQPSVVEAVRATRGEILAFRHRPAEALFHSTCGGRTVAAKSVFAHDVPYLSERECLFCKDSPRYEWTAQFKVDDLANRLKKAGIFRGKLKTVDRKAGESDVRINGSTRVAAGKIRRALGYVTIFSDRYTVTTSKKVVTFKGRGFGHGVGLCQYGAKGMADAGKTYRDILGHYYRGADLKRIY